MGVSNVLGWQPAGSFEESTHCNARTNNKPIMVTLLTAIVNAGFYQ
jgi:hypothetical protein